MKFEIKGPLKENIFTLLRKTGYFFLRKDEEKKEFEFVRPPKGFPRFHLFVKKEGKFYHFSLHLDQKAPIYKGVRAHSGEYEGDVVEREAERIKRIVKNES